MEFKFSGAICALLLFFYNSPAIAEIVKLSASHYINEVGNTVVDIQNVGDIPVVIYSVIVNRKENDPICHLRPFSNLDDELPSFGRSDTDDETLRAIRSKRETSVTLQFADEVGVYIFQGCGSVLELVLKTDAGDYRFRMK